MEQEWNKMYWVSYSQQFFSQFNFMYGLIC